MHIEVLRRTAKRWLKSIRDADPEAVARFRRIFPSHAGVPKLREVQQALAREHGFESWAALKRELEDRQRTVAERIRLLLEKSVHRYGTDPATQTWGDYERDGPARGALAARILGRHPELARHSIHTAVVAHDVQAVRAFLAKDRSLANDRDVFDGWTPLLRLAYARLPIEAVTVNALAIADLLLDAGADPNAGWSQKAPEFTPLVGVIGGGEFGQSAHPLAEAFARLLISRGADPFAPQALYNTSLGADSTFWLDLLWSQSQERGETHKWTGPAPDALGGEKIPSALAYLLGNAVPRRHLLRARWLLAHGADANGINMYSREPVIKQAMFIGSQEMVQLLMDHGATPPRLSEEETFIAAALAGDIASVRALAVSHPEFLQGPGAMFGAIRLGHTAVVELLLDLGVSANIADEKKFTALHCAADCGAVEMARLLIARGADVDPLEERYGGSPLTHALYHGQSEMVEFLVSRSRNFRGLCYAGAVERVRELLIADPGRVNCQDRPGETALFCWPEDEEKAMELVELLLSYGADPSFRNPLGRTAAQVARNRGLDDVADFLEDAAKQGGVVGIGP
jgi:uncharacterized protein